MGIKYQGTDSQSRARKKLNLDILSEEQLYTAISKKVALVIHDARSMFHSPQCIMGASLV